MPKQLATEEKQSELIEVLSNVTKDIIRIGEIAQSANNAANSAQDSADYASQALTAVRGSFPIGSITAFGGSSVPTGWLLCDGSAVSRTTYADLFAVIGTTYGSGNGSTTFNLPDLKDKFIEGSGTNSIGTSKTAGLPNITGGFDGNANDEDSSKTGAFYNTGTSFTGSDGSSSNPGGIIGFDASRSNSIYGNSTTVQPPALVLMYIIKYSNEENDLVPIIDPTLTISNAAADAKVTGDKIKSTQAVMPLFGVDDLLWDNTNPSTPSTHNGVTYTLDKINKTVTVVGTATSLSVKVFQLADTDFSWLQKGKRYIAHNHNNSNVRLQLLQYIRDDYTIIVSTDSSEEFVLDANATGVVIRLVVFNGNIVNTVVHPFISEAYSLSELENKSITNVGTIPDGDLNELSGNIVGLLASGSHTYTNLPFSGFGGTIYNIEFSSITTTQLTIGFTTGVMYYRKKTSTLTPQWTDWMRLNEDDFIQNIGVYGNIDFNDLVGNGSTVGLLSTHYAYTNAPFTTGTIYSLDFSAYVTVQYGFAFGSQGGKLYYRDYSALRTPQWTNWVSAVGGNVYNTTQEITQVYNTNTYSGDVSPVITTDSNGWLQPAGDETDMTSTIMALLNSTGYCHLAPGTFYVSGNINMPERATLEGCGNETVIRLLDSVSTGYCVRVGKYNTVKNIFFNGGDNDVSSSTIGGRNGIIFIANSDGQEATQPIVRPCLVTGCRFYGFSGSAIYGHNSGGGTSEVLTVDDCTIEYCKVGINIDYKTEYCKFSNIVTYRCYYACINNGGNNVFTGCTFHGTIGFLLDNSSSTKTNNAHGSCIGCTFNHIDNWNHPDVLGMGEAIKFIGSSTAGFIFSGCQIWYGSITVNNAKGVCFNSCLIGGNTPQITIENNATAFFEGCMFRQTPNVTNTAVAKFDNCYLISDGSVITGL